MSNRNGVISAPVDLARDVYPMLGMSVGAEGCSLMSACLSPRINRFSRCKPYASEKLFGLTDVDREVMNFGLTPAAVTEGVGWGQPAAPRVYRLEDFDGYNHWAGCSMAKGALRMDFPGGLEDGTVLVIEDRASMWFQVEGEDHVGLKLWDCYDPMNDVSLGKYRVTMVFGLSAGDFRLKAGEYWIYQDGRCVGSYEGESNFVELAVDEDRGALLVAAQGNRNGFYLAVGLMRERLADRHCVGLEDCDLRELVSLDMWGLNRDCVEAGVAPAIFEMRRYWFYAVGCSEEQAAATGSEFFIPARMHLQMSLNDAEAVPSVDFHYSGGAVVFHCQLPWVVRTGNFVDCNAAPGELMCVVRAVCRVYRCDTGRLVGSAVEAIGHGNMNGRSMWQVPSESDADGRELIKTVRVNVGGAAPGVEYRLEIEYYMVFMNEGGGDILHTQYFQDVNGKVWPVFAEPDGVANGFWSYKGTRSAVLVQG